MNGYANPDRPDLRLSDAERDAAIASLAEAQASGRLTGTEYQERAASARSAVTRGDLAPLFVDLPESAPAPAVPVAAAPAPPSAPASRALWGRTGATIMAVTPFVAVALFFITGFMGGFAWSWLWFLLVPAVGALIYGGNAAGGRSG